MTATLPSLYLSTSLPHATDVGTRAQCMLVSGGATLFPQDSRVHLLHNRNATVTLEKFNI